MECSKEWLALYGQPDDTPGCFRTSDKKGPCVAPCPTLSQRAEEVLGLFWESMGTVIGMGVGMAPNRSNATALAEACGIEMKAELLMLFGDLERAWITYVNTKKPEA